MDGQSNESELDLNTRLNLETALIAWPELVRHFARGAVLHVSSTLDLLTVAACLIEDDKDLLQTWLSSDEVRRATDDDARDWTAREPQFWCVVTAPWVLVQESVGGSTEPTLTVIQ